MVVVVLALVVMVVVVMVVVVLGQDAAVSVVVAFLCFSRKNKATDSGVFRIKNVEVALFDLDGTGNKVALFVGVKTLVSKTSTRATATGK